MVDKLYDFFLLSIGILFLVLTTAVTILVLCLVYHMVIGH